MRSAKKVEITYHKGSGGEPEHRTICPFSFAVEQGAWYLIAHCDRSEGIRIFRVDRIVRLQVLYESFDRPKNWRVEELLADGHAFVGPAIETMRVRYSPKVARWVAEREQGSALGDGSLEVEHPVADQEWAIRHVLQYGGEAVVLDPLALRDAIRERLERLVSA
jgi:proteasome accessory factor C